MKNIKIIIGILVAVAIVFILAKLGYQKVEDATEKANSIQAAALEVKENDWVFGSSEAKVTVIEYLDFECSACAAYYNVTKAMKDEYKDSIRFVVRYFPLAGHANAKPSAYAAEAAGRQGKFWEMHDILLQKQSEWGNKGPVSQEVFEQYAVEAGVANIEQWKNDFSSDDVKNRVEENYKEAMSLNLPGTPTFFVDGKLVRNLQGYNSIKQLIDEGLEN